MIGPDRLTRVSAEAVVPEQVIHYVRAVAGSQPQLVGSCVGYKSDDQLVLVGYPLHDPFDAEAMVQSVDQALKVAGLRKITVIGPARPPQAPPEIRSVTDSYHVLPVPPPPPGQKLRNLLRRAARELSVTCNRRFEDDHMALVRRYLNERRLSAGTRHIFRQLPQYIESSAGSRVVSARLGDGRLAAFAVGEYASLHTALFMFCFRETGPAPPGSADLVLSELLTEAAKHGQSRMNLGLGINPGIRFFKRKWGADPFLPCIEVAWKITSPNPMSKLRRLFSR